MDVPIPVKPYCPISPAPPPPPSPPPPSPPPPSPIPPPPSPSSPPPSSPSREEKSNARTETILLATIWISIVLALVLINVRWTVSPPVQFALNCHRPGAVCQDPQFIGGDGLTFYFHGKKDKDFCISLGILFDTHKLYVAAKKTATWDDSVDRLALAFDGEPISLQEDEGATWQSSNLPRVTITRSTETNAVVIEAEGNFKIKAMVVPITQKDSEIHNYGITGEDCFAHLD
ncbi:hypothetical protein RJ641_008344 [Dillenia turbinata]|uniref:Uncharacterized protein n=1 Tax=Dillenia turbinata TaxID=194707 RepID=A0AAN8Z8V8_9MAGN